MSSVANVSVAAVAPAAAARGASGLKQASPTNVRFNSGAAVSFKRMSGLVVRSEGKAEPGSGAGRSNAPTTPTSPPGLSGTEIPLGVISSSAPLAQGTDKPVGERIAYVCQDCGYVYDQETPFEDVSDEYNCPQCKAPKTRFTMANASVEEMLDTTKEDDAVSRGSGEKSGSPPSNSN
jgi:rubredoxin